VTPPIKVLMVTGAYHPEISSGGLQSRLIAKTMTGLAEVRVLTTAIAPGNPRHETIDGIAVTRIHLRMSSAASKLRAAAVMVRELVRLVRWCDVVHVHGVSTKNVFVAAVAKLVGRPYLLSLHTAGADEPDLIRNSGALSWSAFRSASRYLAVSPSLMKTAIASGIPDNRIEHVPNGIDTDRFCPATPEERRQLRRVLGHDVERQIVLFVGFFSHDKQPRVLFDAWLRLRDVHHADTSLVFVGATKSAYHEVDEGLADDMRAEAARRGLGDRVTFTGAVHNVHDYFRMADVFVLPSRREGLPVALMEAMSCGLPSVASRLPGATDTLIEDGVSGRLVTAGDVEAFARAVQAMLAEPDAAARMGAAARTVIARNFSAAAIAERWLENYRVALDRSGVNRS
jgi:glycosyltransferase involved in cell wall biosynthesis